ncbi:MAG TPA: branched-chain amino acid ABC transporter permease [Ignavibacteria bacterium]|nr:branched-chain amino acid ABC transporter permease [Bacteroidota bacterium]HRI84382.1 branched-chain amino acid ABC transporter permease [Ignavibacteria bacterium]HRK00655.1 branched-chain amino acid ABC transporter permease [Ignavibacteria bacterium]
MKNKLLFLSSLVLVFIINLFAGNIDPYYYTILIYIGINIILASSLNLINGYTGQFSLGHAGFMAIGAYLSVSFSTYFAPFFIESFGQGIFGNTISFIILLLIGGIAAAIAGIIVGVPSLRLKGDYLAITTLGFAEIIRVIIQSLDVVGASQGFRGAYIFENGMKAAMIPADMSSVPYVFYSVPKYTNFFWTFAFVVIIIFFISNLMSSSYGRGFLAVKDDEIAAESMGVNTTKFKVIAFVSGAFFAGIAGALYGHFNLYINPEDFNFLKSVEIVVMVILGGMGSMIGVIIAAVILTILPEFLRGISEYRMIIYALLLIIMMLLRPQGLFGVQLRPGKKNKNK